MSIPQRWRGLSLLLSILFLITFGSFYSADAAEPSPAVQEEPDSETGTASPLTATEAEADNGAEAAPDYEYEEPDFAENRISYPILVLRTVAILGALIIGIYFLFRVLVKNKKRVVADSDVIKVLSTYPLAANRFIQVVDIGGQVLVLGVSDSNINLITELTDTETVDRIRLLSSKEKTGGSFKDQFFGLLGGRSGERPGSISHLMGYKNRINRMKKM